MTSCVEVVRLVEAEISRPRDALNKNHKKKNLYRPTRTRAHADSEVRARAHTHTHTHTHKHTYTHTLAWKYKHKHTHTYTHAQTCIAYTLIGTRPPATFSAHLHSHQLTRTNWKRERESEREGVGGERNVTSLLRTTTAAAAAAAEITRVGGVVTVATGLALQPPLHPLQTLGWCNGWQAVLANLHEWVQVLLGVPFTRFCATTSKQKKKTLSYIIFLHKP